MEMKGRDRLRLFVDTDTGSDDAVALVMALQDGHVQIEAITVVAGNVPVEKFLNLLHGAVGGNVG